MGANLLAQVMKAIKRPRRDYDSVFRARVIDGCVRFSWGAEEWVLPLSGIVLVGEYTNEDGPFGEDWFVVLVSNLGEWFEIPVLHRRTSPALDQIAEYLGLGSSLGLKLVGSTTFNSRVVWPEQLRDQDLYTYSKPAFRWRNLLTNPLYTWVLESNVSEPVMKYLERQRPAPSS